MKYSISDLANTKGTSEPVRQALYEMEEEISKKDKRIAELEQALRDRSSERDTAIGMLADWCVAVELNGANWDDWDEHYKTASYRPCAIRELLDIAIYERKPMEGKP